MAEYIERETAKDELLSWAVCINHPEHLMREDAIYVLNAIPAADVAPVRHGRWLSWDELHGGNTLAKNVLGVFCSECIRQSDSKTNFCHNCGAMMDGGDGNRDMA